MRRLFCAVFFLLAPLSLLASTNTVVLTSTPVLTSTTPVISTSPIVLTPIQNLAFKAGEKFEFDLKYEFISGGKATLEVQEGELVNNRPTLKFVSHAKSNKFIDVFFKVRDFNASQVDKESMASVAFHQNLREGKYKVVRNTRMDYANRSYTYERFYKGRRTERTGVVTEAASDILSAFYYCRLMALEPGGTYFITVFSDGKTYPLRVEVGKKLKKVRVKAGKFECLVVRPFVIGDAVFKVKSGRMTIYMTNDERKIPVVLSSKVFVGSFDAELIRYTLPD